MSLGQIAFEAYRAARGGVNHDGTPTPTWDKVTPAIQSGWEAAANAVAARVERAAVSGVEQALANLVFGSKS